MECHIENPNIIQIAWQISQNGSPINQILKMQIKIKKLSLQAIIPCRATSHDAGYDLFATNDDIIYPGQRKLFKTNIAIAIPEGHYGRIADRSGNACKMGLHVLGGVIDAGYRGDIGVILYNTAQGDETNVIQIKAGMRIAQLIIEKCHSIDWVEVIDLDETKRGEGGFGSTGK